MAEADGPVDKKSAKKAKKKARRLARRRATSMGTILGRHRRQGRWLVSKRLQVLVVGGGCRLDLRQACFESPKSHFLITTVLGSTEIIVPPGTWVRASGLSLVAVADVNVPEPTSGTRSITIDWSSFLGKVSVSVAR
jgi:predicted membrane protein